MSKVCQLFSGSSGNSIFIKNGNTSFLVDAGVSAKRIENKLAQIGEDAKNLSAVFVTHEHSDHIGGIRVLCSRYSIPVYTNENSLIAMKDANILNNKFKAEVINSKTQFDTYLAQPFEVSHDSKGCNGFRFELSDGRKISVCTDTGYITDDARETIKGSNLVFLESNHEVRMVENGAYPYYLKKRILSNRGHLSNDCASEFAKELVESGTAFLVLSHLSLENNMPQIARDATSIALQSIGATENKDYRLFVSGKEDFRGPIIL